MKIDTITVHESCVDTHGICNEQRVSYFYNDNKYAIS